MSKNRKIVHDIRGKLSPVSHLIWATRAIYDDDLNENMSSENLRIIQDKMEEYAKLADKYFQEVLEKLDEIE